MKNKITLFCSNVFWALLVSLFFITNGIRANEIEEPLGDNGTFLNAALSEYVDYNINTPAIVVILTPPPNVIVQCGEDYSPASTGVATITSGYTSWCPNLRITYEDKEVNTTRSDRRIIIRTWILLDNCCVRAFACQKIEILNGRPLRWINEPRDETIECDVTTDSSYAFNIWLNSFTGEGGCADAVVTNNSNGLSNLCGNTGSETVTFTLTDDEGNSIEKDATFTINDTILPTWVAMPTDRTVECDGTTDSSVAFTTWLTSFTGTDSCGNADVTSNSSGLSDLCGVTGAETVLFTLTDECGNSIEKEATFTINDNTPPMWVSMPTDKIIQCDGTTDSSVAFTTWLTSFTGTDSCGNAVVENNSSGLSDLCGTTGSETVLFTLTDECGNSIEKEVTFTIKDITPPIWISIPEDKIIQCDGTTDSASAFTTWLSSFTGEDSCGNVVVTNNSSGLSDLCGTTGTETVLFTLTDECGNSIEKEATFTIEDNTPPTWVLEPEDKIIQCDQNMDVDNELTSWLTSFSGEDTCGYTVVTTKCSELSDLCGATGAETVLFTLTDECGNSIEKVATFTIEDNTPPTWVLIPEDKIIQCDGDLDVKTELTNWLTSFTGTDSCGDAVVTTNSSGLSDLCGSTGSEIVMFTLTDECGNSIVKEATFTIEDNIQPTWVLMPEDKTIQCDGDTDVETELTNWLTGFTGVDTCGNAVVTTNSSGLSNLCGATGTETVLFTLTDECGNSIEKEATFTVEDNTNPTITVPDDITIECSEDISSALLGVAIGEDSCGNVIISEEDAEELTCGNSKIITRTWLVTDECGNTATGIQTITIVDTKKPVLSGMPENITVSCLSDVPGEQGITATDTCDDNVIVLFTQSELPLCGGDVINTWEATDACGNKTVYSQTVIVDQALNTDFTEDLPKDITVECNEIPEPETLTVVDNCGGEVTINFNEEITIESEACSNNYIITRTWEFIDCAENIVTHKQVITVIDTTAPELKGLPESEITVVCSDIPEKAEITATDNCSETVSIEFKETMTEVDDNGNYQIIREWLANDGCDNITEFVQTITVEPLPLIVLSSVEICLNDGSIDLSGYISEDVKSMGYWEDEDDSGGLEGYMFNSSLVSVGTYNFTFSYQDRNITADCLPTYTIQIVVHDRCIVLDCETIDGITISKVVTPNGDSYNDYFEISDVRSCGFIPAVKIFNRWGQLMYESDDYYNDWDGYHNNSGMTVGSNGKLPSGTYYYIVNIGGSGFDTITGYIYLGTN